MRITRTLLLASSLLCTFALEAKVEKLVIENKKISLDLQEGWESVKDLFGVPLTILGPYENNSRPVIVVTPTGVTADKMPEKEFQALFTDFKKEKEEWVKSKSGKLLKYEPVTPVELSKGITGHFIGAEFIMNDVTFTERSYYVYCKKDLYNLKLSIRAEHAVHLPVLKNIIESFKCE